MSVIEAKPRIFISYSRKDGEDFAANLKTRLIEKFGKEAIWRDRDEMEGGRSWWEQITEALDAVEYMVLIATPEAMASEVVAKEWRYARQAGVCVYPVQVPGKPIDFKSLLRWMADSHFYNLDKEWDTFIGYLTSKCDAVKVPFMPPDLPKNFVMRDAPLAELKARLLDSKGQNPVAITTALQGAGGFGKTTLASALCHDEDVQTAFDDGVLWVTLGEQPEIVGALTKLYRALTNENPGFIDAEEGSKMLADKLMDKNCLIAIDDVWNTAHLRPFLRGGERCARLITTRDAGIAVNAHAMTTTVDEMEKAESATLLSSEIEGLDADEVAKLAARLGEWALMLELANAMMRERIAVAGDSPAKAVAWLNTLLDKRGVRGIQRDDQDARKRDAAGVLGGSLHLLTSDEREQIAMLSVFRDDSDVPLSSVGALWGTDEFDTKETILKFARLTLIRYISTGSIRLHDVIREYLETLVTDLTALHRQLIDGWGDLYALSDDYAWRNISYHLIAAGREGDLSALLLDYRWLQTKLDKTDTNELIADCGLLSSSTSIRLVKSALNLSAHILSKRENQLAGQLYGRLINHQLYNSSINSLLETIVKHVKLPAFIPTTPSLIQAGGALIRTLVGHAAEVYSVAWSQDGKYLASASDDATIKIWIAETGEELSTLSGHRWRVNVVIYSPDGKYIASASKDQTIKLWDAITYQEVKTFHGHEINVSCLSFSPDSKYIASGSYGRIGKVWDIETGKELFNLIGHTNGINTINFSPDGSHIASASIDGTFKIWSATNAKEIMSFDGGQFTSAIYSPNGEYIVSASHDGVITVRAAQTGEEKLTLRDDLSPIESMSFSPDGEIIVFSYWDTTLKTRDAKSLGLLMTLKGHTSAVNAAVFSPDGLRIASASSDNTIKIWDARAEQPVHKSTEHLDPVCSVAFSRNSNFFLSGSWDETIKIWDVLSGHEIRTLQGHTGAINALAFASEDGFVFSGSDDTTLRLWNIDTGENLTLVYVKQGIEAIAISPDGQSIAYGGKDKTLRYWDIPNGTEHKLTTLGRNRNTIKAVAFSPDGSRIAYGALDDLVRVWNVTTGKRIMTLKGHTHTVSSVAYSPDGTMIMSGSYDGTIRLWASRSGRTLRVLTGHTSTVYVVWSADGQYLISSSWDMTIRLWDSNTGECLAIFNTDAELWCVAISPNSKFVAAGDGQGRIILLRVM